MQKLSDPERMKCDLTLDFGAFKNAVDSKMVFLTVEMKCVYKSIQFCITFLYMWSDSVLNLYKL